MQKKFIGYFTLAVSCFSFLQLLAGSASIGGRTWTYELGEGDAVITGVTPNTGSVVIPQKIDGYPVTEIGEGVFEECTRLTSVTIPEGVETIGPYAFCWSGLREVKLPSTLKYIEEGAFEGCQALGSAILPMSIRKIGPWAFNGCKNLKEIGDYQDPAGMRCGSRSFSDVPSVKFAWVIQGSRLVGYRGACPPNLQIPAGVTEIGVNESNGTELAFEGSQTLVSLTIPSSVTYIEEWAMTDCPNLKAVVLPEGMTHLPEGLFDQDAKLANLILPASVKTVGEMSLSEIAGPVVFLGDKPTVVVPSYGAINSRSPFDASDSYKVYFLPGAKGWVNGGTWCGMRTYAISDEELARIKRARDADLQGSSVGGGTAGFVVQFNANGGTGTMAKESFVFDTAKALTANAFKRNGYAFAGWSTEPGGPVAYGDGAVIKNLTETAGGVVTLYAAWELAGPWPFDSYVANVYDGYLVDEAQAVVGTIQVKTAKQAVKTVTDKVTKVKSVVTNVAVTATVTDPAAKKWRYSKGAVAMPVVDGLASVTGLVCTAKGVVVTNFTVSVGLNGMSGAWGDYEIVGARNGMGVKGDPMMTALDGYKKSWSATVGGTRLQLTPGAKGTTKIAGTTPDGFKISASVQGVMGDGAFYVPYVATLKNGRLTKFVDLLLRVLADGTVEVLSSSLGELVEGGATEAPVIADRTARRTILAGVTYSETVAIQELGHPAKFAATKLPTGLKINATTGEITGVPTKAGTYESVIKATSGANSKWIDQITRTYVVEALPPWAVGTFDGGSHEGVGTVTVAATGKISGKWMSEGTNWTLTATSFDAYNPEEDAYWATVVGKSGKLAFTNDLVVTSEVLRTDLFKAYQNNWKVEPLKSEAVNLKGRIFTREVAGGELTLKVGANGTVTITGRFVTGVDARGKEIVYTATGSGVLIPTDSGDYFVYIYLPPKPGKFDGLVTIVALMGGVQLWEGGPYWAECNVGATRPEEYGNYFWWGDTVGYKRNAADNGWVSVKDGSAFSFMAASKGAPYVHRRYA